MGATTPIAAFAATAASTALPPCASIVAPICDASGCSVATIPCRVMTIERACDRSADAVAGQRLPAESRTKRMLVGSKCDAPPRHIWQVDPVREVRIIGIGNIEAAADTKLIRFLGNRNFIRVLAHPRRLQRPNYSRLPPDETTLFPLARSSCMVKP